MELQIQYLPVGELKPYEKNARKHRKEDVGAIVKSIEEFGMNDPIGIWSDENIIVEGHGRLLACLQLGMEEVPCIRLDHMTDEQRRAYAIAHNKTAELSSWDTEILPAELRDIKTIDMTQFGFMLEPDTAEDDGYEPEITDEEPKTKPGDIYKLGRHRLMCGSSTDKEQVRTLIGGGGADMLLTDPPYGVDYESTNGKKIQNDNLQGTEFIKFLTDAFRAADSVMKPGAPFYIWYADGKGYEFTSATTNTGWTIRQVLIWVKNGFILGRQDYQWQHEPCLYGWKDGAAHFFTDLRTESTVMSDAAEIDLDKMKKEELKELCEELLHKDDIPSTVIYENKPTRDDEHPTMKPVKLFGRLIRNSTKKNDRVLDLFGGSGTSIIACEQLGRKCFTMELDPKYCDVIVDRWEKFTGQKAELIKGAEI